MRAAVRIVFEALDLRGDAVLVALEVDDPIVLLVAAALVPHRDVAVVVATRAALLALGERIHRTALVQVRMDDLDHRPAAGRRRFDFLQGHVSLSCREVDFLARLQADVGLLPAAAPAREAAEALRLALDVDDLDALDLDLEHRLDRRLHLRLGRVGQHLEDHLLVLVREIRGFFRDDRREQHDREALGIVLLGVSCPPPSISSNCATAALVSITLWKRTRLTGSTSRVSSTSTSGRLRDERKTLSSSLSVTTSSVPGSPAP